MTSQMGIALAVAALSGVIVALGTAYLVRPRARVQWLDLPNPRSLHDRAVPRTGGLAILAGVLVGWALVSLWMEPPGWWPWATAAVVLVSAISMADDWQEVGPGWRFAVHLAAAVLLIAGGLASSELTLAHWNWKLAIWVQYALTAALVVWMVNLYNFMDGMDGFAGGMGLIGFAFVSLLAFLAGHASLGAMALVVSAASGAFLVFNFPPARIFMGDTGSSLLGLLAAVALLWADRDDVFPLWAGILIFSPFIADATLTLLWRAWSGARVWEAHRSHCYQVLVQAGWGHRRTVLVSYGLKLFAGTTALVAVRSSVPSLELAVVLGWVSIYGILWFLIRGIGR